MKESELVTLHRHSPHTRGPRSCEIDRITIHCTVGQCTAEALGDWFQLPERHSCNYGVDRDGRIVCIVPEDEISICSSSLANDMRAITIETASDSTWPYAVKPAAYGALIRLCADICRRHGRHLVWIPDKAAALAYNPAPDEMIMTVHRWFVITECPGAFLWSKMQEICDETNTILRRERQNMPTYNCVDELPEWGFRTIQKLISAGCIQGKADGRLDLSEDVLRVLVIIDRSGAFRGLDDES